jgi:hypothetical protein
MPQQLNEINLIRPILIILLVVYHAFAPYCGAWELPDNIQPVAGYFWTAKSAYSFMLEMFVLISGYLFAFQTFEKGKNTQFKKLFIKKLKRLILPSIIFSTIYFLLFRDIKFDLQSIYYIINGAGHLWYLPMLFWCFVAGWFLIKFKANEKIRMLLLFCVAAVSFVPLPLQMDRAMYYLFFFYSGVYIYREREGIFHKVTEMKNLVILISLFLVLFISFTLISEYIKTSQYNPLLGKAVLLSFKNTMSLVSASLGCLTIYGIAGRLLLVNKIVLPEWLLKLNPLCYGVYIFQQFILKTLYYKTEMPAIFGTYWLPVAGCVITLIISLWLSKLMLKFKFGKFLIG